MHWANKFNGDVTIFYNNGQTPQSSSSFTWTNAGIAWRGAAYNDRGTNLHFPNLGGRGRADLHDVNPRANTVRVSDDLNLTQRFPQANTRGLRLHTGEDIFQYLSGFSRWSSR